MIIGEVRVDDVVYSNHRFSASRFSHARVEQLLAEMARAEDLHTLGRIEISVTSQSGLERLLAALWGRGNRPAPARPLPSRLHDPSLQDPHESR